MTQHTTAATTRRHRYMVMVCGHVVSQHRDLAVAVREADKHNRAADRELGYEVIGDGAASVSDRRSSR